MKNIPFFFIIFISLLITGLNILLFSKGDVKAAVNTENLRVTMRFKKYTPGILRKLTLGNYLENSEELRLKDALVIKIPAHNAEKVLASLNRNVWVDYAEQDYEAYALDVPNDPELTNQWGLVNIKAVGGWNETHGSKSVDIAIVDTGIKFDHPDLANKITASVNCSFSSCSNYQTTDPDGHGTHVAGIAAASTNNFLGIAGLAWEGNLMSVKVLDDLGRGYYSWIASGIVWAVDNGAEVINLSLGGSSPSFVLRDAVKYAWDNGAVVIAASGNNSSTQPIYPAYYSWAIAVGATDSNDNKAGFSNYGAGWVDVAAPGVSILSTYKNGYAYISGTSMSAPHVTGLAALIKSLNPGWTNSQIRERIEQTTDPIPGIGVYWSWGRINVCKALDCDVQEVTPTSTPPPTPQPELSNSPTPSFSPTPTSIQSPSPTLIPTLIPTPTPFAAPSPTLTPINPSLPWWCKYVPNHYTCQ